MRYFIILVILLLAAFGIYYFTKNNQQTATSKIEKVPASSPDMPKNIKTFEITGKPFEFNLKEIVVTKGDTVRIVFTNPEGFHDWTIDEFNVKTKQIPAGQSDTIEFIADKTGVFEYYCSVSDHRQRGMVGKLIVE